jgi:hypothetical protein
MLLKTASAIAIAFLSVGALLTLTGDIWTHRLLVMGMEMPWLSILAGAIQVLFFHVPLILFFVVVYRHQTKNALAH